MQRVSSTASELNDFKESNEGKKEYNVSKSRLVKLINWVHIGRLFLPIVWFIVIGVLCAQVLTSFSQHGFDLKTFYANEVSIVEVSGPIVFDLGWKTMALLALLVWFAIRREQPVYLLDFSTWEPPESWKLSAEQLMTIMRAQEVFTEDSLEFLARMLKQSGCGPATAWPPGTVQCLQGLPADRSVEAARKESEVVIFDVVRDLLKKTNTKGKDIDFLVINCSLFSPTPSLCSMVINEFGMRSDISSYNLSGMGCSAGVISVELVKNLLAGRPHSQALIVSTENLTQQLYLGNDRGFLLQNTLFRCGGAAILLSNKWTDALRARFKLLRTVRTQYVSDDSYGCVYETEDPTHKRGVRLSKDIVKVAGRAMEKNFTSLGPYVLPVSEQLKTVFWMAVRFLRTQANSTLGLKIAKINPYIPDFKRGIDHFCIHAGGRGVIDGIEKNLNLTPKHVEASRHALYTYGNTSSSSIWYEMDYVRKSMNLKKGQRVLQIAFGSGFKCNSAVWLCLHNNKVKESSQSSNRDSSNAVKKNKEE